MLQTIREHTHGWIAGTIIGVIILTFALWGIHSYFQGNAGSNVVAVVNGVDITTEQFNATYDRFRRQAQIQHGAKHGKNDPLLKERALQSLIEIQVLKQASINQGFYISGPQIDRYIQGFPDFQVDGQFSFEKFQELLASSMMSTSDFIDLINTSLLIDQPKLGLLLTSFALAGETNYTISLVDQKRDIDYLVIPMSFFLKDPISIPESAIKAYYDEHPNDFMTKATVSVEYITLSLDDIAKRINPTDAELNAFYDENVSSYQQPSAWKLVDVLVPVVANASEDEISKAQKQAEAVSFAVKSGQDMAVVGAPYKTEGLKAKGLLILNQLPSELQNAVAGLKANQVSDPVRTENGFLVVKVIESREPKTKSFADVKDQVKQTLVKHQAEERYAEQREQLADLTYEHPESLKLASDTLSVPVQVTDTFTQDAGNGIAEEKRIRDVAFSNDVLSSKNNSDVIQLDPETVVVIRVKEHRPATLLPLSAVTKQIEAKLKLAEAEKSATAFLNTMQINLQGGDATAIAAKYQLNWKRVGLVERYTKNIDPAILETAFSMPQPANNKPSFGTTKLPSGYAVVAVKSVKQGAISDSKQRAAFTEQVQNSEAILEYELYKQSQLASADIVISG